MSYEYKITCAVCQDLIPLVNDHVASEESEQLVLEHTQICKTCRDLLEQINLPHEIQVDDKKIIQAIKKYYVKIGLAVLLVGAILGVAMSRSDAQFYNLILMPVLGVISVFLLGKKFWISLVGIIVVSYVGEIVIYVLFTRTIEWKYLFTAPLTMMVIYLVLTAVGIIIGGLLKFAFKKEK
ncbi:zf-HC2 domain-containing protein [Paludicola sp. MB14-C6]|uniref:zf-HC2 domain-containing protein n=1 Tax=Paludihabitans sp. MB14-C6 TaxID=3070656 RepID=UPI0027DD66FE|nr:zf-HC2 domain-containing protein [Paludicola sp. MB14-C6]WMJ23786.1 zf-HC2 domain-containing protein [Paludicola sp. MB14-C6]